MEGLIDKMMVMQIQGKTSNATVNVPKSQVLRAKGKKINDTLNILFRVLEASRRIWDVF